MVILSLFSWVLAGLVAGFVASRLVDLRGDDVRFGLGAAVGGALVAGILYAVISGNGLAPWRAWGVLFALIGGAAGAVTWHLIRARSIGRDAQTVRRSY